MDVDIEIEKIERKREYIKYLQETLSAKEQAFSSRENELVELQQKTEEEIGKQVTIHKQQLNIIKKDARIEQQLAYIKILEDDVFELKSKLEESNKQLSNMRLYSRIFEQNQEILVS